MGVSYDICTYLAVEAPLETFFVDTGQCETVCSRDSQHVVRETAKFCEHCGSFVKTRAIKEATPAFLAFCVKEGATPEEAFYLLNREGWEWSDGEDEGKTSYTLHWLEVQFKEASSYDQPENEKRMALGFRLDRKDAKQVDCDILAYTPDIFSRMNALEEVAEVFDLKAEPKLYIQIKYC